MDKPDTDKQLSALIAAGGTFEEVEILLDKTCEADLAYIKYLGDSAADSMGKISESLSEKRALGTPEAEAEAAAMIAQLKIISAGLEATLANHGWKQD